jgi:5-methylcytosine-specific restriction endonuclease McrA
VTEKEIWQAIRGKRKPVNKVSKKRRKSKVGEVRRECYERDEGICQLRLSANCWRSASWEHGHMHHKRHRSLGGKDVLENVAWSCPPCHAAHHVPEKVVPAKS